MSASEVLFKVCAIQIFSLLLMMCLLLHYHMQQQRSGMYTARCFCFVAFHRINMYACFLFFATTIVW